MKLALHAGHERHLREVIIKVPLVTGQVLYGFDVLAWFELRTSVDESESHDGELHTMLGTGVL